MRVRFPEVSFSFDNIEAEKPTVSNTFCKYATSLGILAMMEREIARRSPVMTGMVGFGAFGVVSVRFVHVPQEKL